jgi:hypothetical protein
MTVKELNVGDVFRVGSEEQLWRKMSPQVACRTGPNFGVGWQPSEITLDAFRDKPIETVAR